MINPLLSIQNSPTKFLKPPLSFVSRQQQQQQEERQRKNNTLFTVDTKPRRAKTFACLSISRRRNNDGGGVSESGETAVGFEQVGGKKAISILCGLGYWVQGSRCFPWLALNFHMVHTLALQPSTLQLVQYSCLLPMVAKPLYGVLSDVLYIGSGRRVPYISIGAFLQVLAWGSMGIFQGAREVLPSLIAFVLLSNLGASITEVAKDALVAEYGLRYRINGLQSYALMASAAGGVLGNLLGGYLLLTAPPKFSFLVFSGLLALQLVVSLSSKEESFDLPRIVETSSVLDSVKKSLSNLTQAIQADEISQPLIWAAVSIAMVPLLSGSVFCYQTQVLNLEPSVIGSSKVIGQMMLLGLTVVYDRYLKTLPMRPLMYIIQLSYGLSILLDFILVKQINLRLGISNEVYVLCFSSLAEILAQFKILPFAVRLASMCPRGCEGSVTSFLASALCLSQIVSAFLGVGLANLIGITSSNYSNLSSGILVQSLAALIPLCFLHFVPMSEPVIEKEGKRGVSKRNRRNRRVGRVVDKGNVAYRRERESEEAQR
ncbi:PREDICTED: probable folate-biopterin transporter 8, chloroplastic isoform X1 [Camelina sativa]|uniref:Probable folate-biopterin transporter 8, chloroplastic isoform X1 n=1 Tax=Camelina sativa TaxID=90675 RepID=A0ABM0WRH4_CAMSA|nr:PREDICTED: probable folate-biopterin transporter 8, chloroplastic isoform X1 [Camelina sativa]